MSQFKRLDRCWKTTWLEDEVAIGTLVKLQISSPWKSMNIIFVRSWGIAYWSYECGEVGQLLNTQLFFVSSLSDDQAACECFRQYPPSWSPGYVDVIYCRFSSLKKTFWGFSILYPQEVSWQPLLGWQTNRFLGFCLWPIVSSENFAQISRHW